MIKKLIIATRGSKLALWQSHHIKDEIQKKFPLLEVELKIIKTTGDKILDTPLALIGGKGLFTKEIEEAMLGGKAHLAVHSLKDVPTELPAGLTLSAITKREDVRDAMLSEKYASLDDLPIGAVVGTTSLRRRMQLLRKRPDLVIKDLRGNVDTRIRKLKEGEFDAIILAAAGINRLGLKNSVNYFIPIETDWMIPAMGQAALGIETVLDDEVLKIARALSDEQAMIETTVERSFVDRLQGGCQVPLGVNAKLSGDRIEVRAILGLPNGKECLAMHQSASREDYVTLGLRLAEEMIKQGAKELLSRAEEMAFK